MYLDPRDANNSSTTVLDNQDIIINEDKSFTLVGRPDLETPLVEITGDKKQNLIDTKLFDVEYLLESLLKITEETN